MKDAIVLDGRFRVFDDGTIFRIKNGVEVPAKTFDVGRASSDTKYKTVSYMENGKQKQIAVHRLVALAFLPNPENKPEVNHIDGDKSNNNVSNLEWVTRSENTQHAYDTKLINPMRNGTPCVFCGTITRSKTKCCDSCLSKVEAVAKRIEKLKLQKEKYAFADLCALSKQQERFVRLAQTGMINSDIAREMKISRQRVDQISKQVKRKQAEATL